MILVEQENLKSEAVDIALLYTLNKILEDPSNTFKTRRSKQRQKFIKKLFLTKEWHSMQKMYTALWRFILLLDSL